MRELEAERKMLNERLEAANEADSVIALHPKALDRYKRAVTELALELKCGAPTEFATIREVVTAIMLDAVVAAEPERCASARPNNGLAFTQASQECCPNLHR